jgi:hypothetical protein
VISVKVTTKSETKTVLTKARQGSFKSLGHAGAAIRLTARRSIRRRKSASPAGTPPSTRRGQLKRAIAFAVDKQQQLVVIGPEYEVVGESGKAHEFGGRYRREQYEKRPFMGPALEKVKDRLPSLWAGSVH